MPGSRSREFRVAFAAIMLATLLAALDQTIVATALPRIASDLGAFDQLSWVVTAYLLASTITIPIYGQLSDLFGRRRLFVLAIVLFLAGSALCGAAGSLGELIGFRALQGLGAGGLVPLSQAAIGDLLSPRERGRYNGFIGSMWAAAAIAGPLLGGVLTDQVSWRWIFFLNIPLAAVALAVLARTDFGRPGGRRGHSIDWAGAAALGVASTGLLLACTWGGTRFGWGSLEVLGAAGAGLLALAGLPAIERRAVEPLLPRTLFRSAVPRVTFAGAVVVGALILGLTIYVPVFIQGGLGRSATTAGTLLIPFLLGWVCASFVSGQLVARRGRYRIFPVLGGCLVLAGTSILALVSRSTPEGIISGVLTLAGMGMGLTWPVYVLATQNALSTSQLGTGTASLLFFRTMAGSLAVAAFGALLNTRLSAELHDRLGARADLVDTSRLIDRAAGAGRGTALAAQEALAASLHTVFVLMVPLAAALLVLALLLEERPLRQDTRTDAVGAARMAPSAAGEPS